MKVELKKIASVQMGYSLRSRLDDFGSGETAVIQMKDLTADNLVDCSRLTRVHLDGVRAHHFVRPGDLVFRSRGQNITAALLRDDPGRGVVAAPLLRIRAHQKVVYPEYLHWYINHPVAQLLLARMANGTAQKMISTRALESLEVPVPSLDRQRLIAELASMAVEEQVLMEKYSNKRNQYISRILIQLAKGE